MNRREAKLYKMKQKREKDLEEAKKGVTFPEYNPLPKRREDLTTLEKKVKRLMSCEAFLRKKSKTSSAFIGWEYKDRFSYRK